MARHLLYYMGDMKRLIPAILISLTSLLMGACSTSMGGHVYLDANNNKEVDGGEKGVQGVHYTITKDDKKVGEGYTDATGGYALKVKEAGKYCINLDKVSLQGQDLKYKPSLSASALIEELAPPPAPAPVPPGKSLSMAKGLPDPATPATPPTPSPTTTPPADPYAKTAPAAPAGPADGTVTLSAMSGCVQMGLSSQDMDLPIVPDYSGTIQSILVPATKSLGPGENFDYKVIWPASCRLVSSAIPDIFISTGDVGIASDVAPSLDFSEPVVAESVSLAKDLTKDGLASKVIKLRVKNGVSGDKTQHVLKLSVLCPDGTTYTLPGQEITIVSKAMVAVTQNLIGTHGLGDSPEDEVTIENNTEQSFVAAKLTVGFTNMVAGVVSEDPSCKNLGDDIVCTFDLQPNEKRVVKIKFTLPKTITVTANSNKEEYSVNASLKIASQTDAITADKIHFYLIPAPTP